MKFVFSREEIKEIGIAAVVLSVAFAIAYQDGIMHVNAGTLPKWILFSFIAVGIGFLAHELIGHKLFAQRFGLHAEFRKWNMGLAIAFVSSLFGFVFAAPGAVYISQKLDMWGNPKPTMKKHMGITSLMGPVVNLLIAGLFFAASLFVRHEIFALGIFINIWLALFNMLPIPPLDGSKVLAWDKRVFAAAFAVIIAIFVLIAV